MKRIAVVGCPGTGKTTLAAALAEGLGLAHIELDTLQHRPGWTESTDEEFRSGLDAAMAAAVDGWVICGNYRSKSEHRHTKAADTLVWLDLPRATVMRRVVGRTLRRAVTREELFGQGLREPLTNFYRWDPEHNIIRWAWTKYHGYREQYLAAIADGSYDHLDVHQLQSPAEVERFLAEAIADRR